jgi:hypothetical protein
MMLDDLKKKKGKVEIKNFFHSHTPKSRYLRFTKIINSNTIFESKLLSRIFHGIVFKLPNPK